MSDEELQRKMAFIVEQQAQFAINIQRLEGVDERAQGRIERLERVVKLAIRTGMRERKDFRERYAALLDSQIKTEDTVRATTANISVLTVATERNREDIQALTIATERNREDIQALTAATDRNREDIAALIKFAMRSRDKADGDGA
ncbi:MAG: hypothetical protein ABR577_03365 [Pyrinomonadaceae bacterium]